MVTSPFRWCLPERKGSALALLFSRRTFLAAVLGAAIVPSRGQAARLTSVDVTLSDRLPRIRPKWPVPAEPHQLFYIQRSTNPNTIVYTARFGAGGVLNAIRPAQAYWRRFNDNGERMELRPLERRLAFGMRIKPHDTPGEWTVTARAAPQFPMHLRQGAPWTAHVRTRIGGRVATPVYCFVMVDETGIIPWVTQFSIHGMDQATGRAISETFAVSGGAIRP